jgi:hypothetical protein
VITLHSYTSRALEIPLNRKMKSLESEGIHEVSMSTYGRDDSEVFGVSGVTIVEGER